MRNVVDCFFFVLFLEGMESGNFILGDAQFVGCSSIWVVLLLLCCFFGGLTSIKEEVFQME
jgi:hypothetical protein